MRQQKAQKILRIKQNHNFLEFLNHKTELSLLPLWRMKRDGEGEKRRDGKKVREVHQIKLPNK